ncbi:MAG: putative addiction module antidote protein [Candidatus Electrothrix sp. AR4]|nr:putative addiction module antidote protein [Candidatus Electrothrix sp. AR4]
MMTEVAGKAGLNRESLYKALAGEGDPRFSTVSRGIKELGCRMAVA